MGGRGRREVTAHEVLCLLCVGAMGRTGSEFLWGVLLGPPAGVGELEELALPIVWVSARTAGRGCG